MTRIFAFCVFLVGISITESTCILPLSPGLWKTSTRGTWKVDSTRTTISGFEFLKSSGPPIVANMSCYSTDTDGYILLKSSIKYVIFESTSTYGYAYACILFNQSNSSPDTYYFSLGSAETFEYERVYVLRSNFSFNTHCNSKSTAGERIHVAIKAGSEENATAACPSDIKGTFSYTNDTRCNSTYLNACSMPTPTQLLFNYSICPDKQMFSATGILNCVYSTTHNGYTYLTIFNNDTTVDTISTYRFTCMVLLTSDNTVWASINPKECFNSSRQTPYYTDHPIGVTRTFTNFRDYFCYPTTTTPPTTTSELTTYTTLTTEETTNATTGTTNSTTDSTTVSDSSPTTDLSWLYILIVIIIIAIIVAMIICIIWALSRKKRRDKQKKADQERDEKQKTIEVEKEKCNKEEESKIHEQVAEPTKIVEEDISSIDSGFVQGKTDAKHKEDQKKDINEERNEDNRKPDSYEIYQQNETLNEIKYDDKTNNDDNDNSIDNKSTDIKTKESSQTDIKQNITVLEDKNNSNDNNTNQISDDENNEEIETCDKVIDDDKDISKDEIGLNDTKRLDETDNETKIQDDGIVSKKIKQKRSVKIYENSDWNDHEDQQGKHRDMDDNGTDQNNKIINVQGKEELEDQDKQHEHEVSKDDENEPDRVGKGVQNEQDGLEDKDNQNEQEVSKDDENEPDRVRKDKQDEKDGEHSTVPEKKEQSRPGSILDPEEVERNIENKGMKKSRKYQPDEELSKVLVSRKMEEQIRKNADQGTWSKMKNLFRVKTKKIKDIIQTTKGQKRSTTDSGDIEKTGNKVTPFMKEYLYKKQMDEQLYEQHVLECEPDYSDRLKDSDNEDFSDFFYDNNKLNDGKGKETDKINQFNMEQINAENKRLETGKLVQHTQESTVDDTTKKAECTEDQAKDSGVDSPDIKKEKTDQQKISNDDMNDMDEIIISEPPPGFFRDNSGRIIRKYDKKVMTEEEMQSIFPLAKLRMLFHVPRLKRTSSGRPTGDYIIDDFGQKLDSDKENKQNMELRDEHSKPKHPRSSLGSGRKEHRDQQKSVAFEMDDRQSDIFMIEDEDASSRPDETSHRELLRKRLLRNKKRSRLRNGDQMYSLDEGRPRELSDLVRVIPQNAQKNSINGRVPIPGTVISRNDSIRNRFDPEQHLMYREGLAVDKQILEKSELNKHRPLGMPREAFIEDDPAENRASMANEEIENQNNRDGDNTGNDDDFVLVGNTKDPNERLFTYVRRPGQTPITMVRPLQGSQESFHHDMRHSIPWSIINQYHIRDSSVLNANSLPNTPLAPKSAANAKREIDDRRLRKLLEELYKDKKYFDHVINTTDPNSEPIIDERMLAEHGREFLLERAEYWDEKGVAIPRPPQTALGLRLSRIQMAGDSGRVSNISYASTVTPPPPPENLSNRNNTSQAFQTRENTIV